MTWVHPTENWAITTAWCPKRSGTNPDTTFLSGADNSKRMLLSFGNMPALTSHAIHIRCPTLKDIDRSLRSGGLQLAKSHGSLFRQQTIYGLGHWPRLNQTTRFSFLFSFSTSPKFSYILSPKCNRHPELIPDHFQRA